ncbi:hypothetical protein L0Y59_01655 [Candidatus Uhrbacteria bacterium]|nr:hypothetical protein [Candidatus Uhrbacteria bacterium]
MAKDKALEESALLPVIAANLIANAFELSMEPDLASAGSEVRRLGRENKGAFTLFQTAVMTFIQTRSGMSENTKIHATKLLDTVFDRMRRLPVDAPYQMRLSSLEEAGRAILALVTGSKKSETKVSRFAKIEAELTATEQDEFLKMSLFLRTWDSGSYGAFMDALERVDAKARVQRMLKLVDTAADQLPEPPPAPSDGTTRPADFRDRWRTCQKRIAFLQSSMATSHDVKDILTGALFRGEQTPQGKALEAKILKFSKDANDFAGEQRKKADEIRNRNMVATENADGFRKFLPILLFGVACVALFFFALAAL